MSASVPDWLAHPNSPATTRVPDWLTSNPKRDMSPFVLAGKSPEVKAMMLAQFEMVFPRVLEEMCAGKTANCAIKDLPLVIDVGAFMRWVKKDTQRYAQYKEAKEVRTEVWAGEMIKHALGEDVVCELDRSKFIAETYKWLMKAENKKEYGETKQIEVTQTISIIDALQEAKTRAIQVIDVDADEVLDTPDYKQLRAAVDAEWDEDNG